MADAPQEDAPLKTLELAQEMVTVYLYSLYTLKGGRLTQANAISAMLGFASAAERAEGIGKMLLKPFVGSK